MRHLPTVKNLLRPTSWVMDLTRKADCGVSTWRAVLTGPNGVTAVMTGAACFSKDFRRAANLTRGLRNVVEGLGKMVGQAIMIDSIETEAAITTSMIAALLHGLTQECEGDNVLVGVALILTGSKDMMGLVRLGQRKMELEAACETVGLTRVRDSMIGVVNCYSWAPQPALCR